MTALLVGFTSARAHTVAPGEYEIKAAFLFNFSRFVDWPEQAVREPEKHYLCIAGANPFGAILEEMRGRVIKGKKLAIRLLSEIGELPGCQVLFVGQSDKSLVQQLLAASSRLHILTVADTPGFLQDGGMIELRVIDSKVRFDINLDAAGSAKLQISSRLLNLANKVYGEEAP